MSSLQSLIRELVPAWRDIKVEGFGKYLGFYIGPAAGTKSWEAPLQKYCIRVANWASLRLGMHLNTSVYRVFIASVLSFVMQLEMDTPAVLDAFQAAMRRLLPGPGNWISYADITHLCSCYNFPATFSDPRWTSIAAKLRVVRSVATDCREKHEVLVRCGAEYLQRPFGR